MKSRFTRQPKLNAVIASAFVCASLLPACSSSSKKAEEVAGISSGASDSRSGYRLRPYQEKTLPNGLRLVYVPDQTLPYVSYSVLVASGASQDPQGQAGLTSFVAELLDNGTVKRSATQIANELGQMGADFDATASSDYTMISASAVSTQAEPLLRNLVEIITQPAFSDVEVDRVRREIMAGLEKRIDNPSALADVAYENFLFGTHPYARPVNGTMKSVASIKKKNIIQQYIRHYRPNNAIVSVTGKFTPELVAQIEQAFSTWEKRDVPPDQFGPIPAINGVQVQLVDKPGMVQAQIRMGHAGIKRQDEDFLTLRVANSILGRDFSSRLFSRIREQLGLTYSIDSSFDARQDVGPFEISTFTKSASVGQTIQESIQVFTKFVDDGVTKDEVAQAKGYLKGVFPTAIETPERLALNLMILRFYGIPDSYLTNYLTNIDRISASDVNKVIKKHFHPKNLRVVVHASAPDVLPQLQQFGQVEVKKAEDLR